MKKKLFKSFALVCALIFAISCNNKGTTGPTGGGGGGQTGDNPSWFLTADQQKSPWEIHQTLFDTKEGDIYRITGIVVSKKNTLIAVSDSRKTSESDVGFSGSQAIDIVLRRSTDGGKTWGDVITVLPKATGALDAHGDPLIFSCQNGDLVLLCAAGGAWNQGVGGDSKVMMSRSTDDGITWTQWKEVQSTIFSDPKMTSAGYNKGFAASGRGLTMKDGTLMGAMLVGDKDNTKKAAACIVSTDNGETWTVRGIAKNNNNQDEPKIVAELDNGDILMSVRPETKNKPRVWFTSSDKGVTWTEKTLNNPLIDGKANGEGVRYTSVNSGHKKSRLLHINCNGNDRHTLTVVMSEDEGNSWDAAKKVIQPGNSCYPSIDVLGDGTIVTYAEEPNVGQNPGNGHYDMVFRRFNLAWLTDGAQVYDENY